MQKLFLSLGRPISRQARDRRAHFRVYPVESLVPSHSMWTAARGLRSANTKRLIRAPTQAHDRFFAQPTQ